MSYLKNESSIWEYLNLYTVICLKFSFINANALIPHCIFYVPIASVIIITPAQR
jgi:hypothetical protein